MKRIHIPFFTELIFVLVLSVLLAVACGTSPLSVHVKNGCNDNIKLCKNCEHIKSNATDRDALGFYEANDTATLQIWRAALCMAQWNVTALTVPDEDSDDELQDTITITAEIVDPTYPFDDIFSAKSSKGYVSLTREECPDPEL